MPCFTPLEGWKSRVLNDNCKRQIVFNRKYALDPSAVIKLPCGQCVGCRLERSRQWAIRCVHEASLYENNSFITLTYADEFLPEDRSLKLRHFQLFMKRLRKKYGADIRFYHCGEYGEKYGRPHYHAIIFNHDFVDKSLWKVINGQRLYVSDDLARLWPFGHSSIGSVTFESAAYVARYIMKKINGDAADAHYKWIDPETGEVFQRAPEYTTMSRRPGIGSGWYSKFNSDVYPADFVVMNGKKMKPPKYYDGLYERDDRFAFDELKDARAINAATHLDNNTPDRLKVRHEVQLSRLKRLPRNLD